MSLVSCWNHGPVGLLPPILFLRISHLHCSWVWPRDFLCPMEHSKHVLGSHWMGARVLGLALSYCISEHTVTTSGLIHLGSSARGNSLLPSLPWTTATADTGNIGKATKGHPSPRHTTCWSYVHECSETDKQMRPTEPILTVDLEDQKLEL